MASEVASNVSEVTNTWYSGKAKFLDGREERG